jgi:hypothetical protein
MAAEQGKQASEKGYMASIRRFLEPSGVAVEPADPAAPADPVPPTSAVPPASAVPAADPKVPTSAAPAADPKVPTSAAPAADPNVPPGSTTPAGAPTDPGLAPPRRPRRPARRRIDWAVGRDFGGARSLDDFLTATRARARANAALANTAAKAVRLEGSLAERNAARRAVGLDPIVAGRRRRPDGTAHDSRARKTGRTLADYPELVGQWHPTRNGVLTPADVRPASRKRIWWRCDAGHEWETTAVQRTSTRTSCPYHANRLVAPENSLAALYPDIAREWVRAVRPGPASPAEVTPGSFREVVWNCDDPGHPEFVQRVVTRTRQGQGCPEHGRERVRAWHAAKAAARRAARFGDGPGSGTGTDAPGPADPPEHDPPGRPDPDDPDMLF